LFQRFDPAKLPSPFVRAIYQDKAGFIWLGTRSGLCRFDGQNYLRFSHEPGNPGSLANHHIRSILEDRSGNLWLCTFGGGLSCLDPASRRFKNYPLPRNSAAGRIHKALFDRNENLWLATESGGLVQFLQKEKRYRCIRFPEADRKALLDLRCISPGKEGSFWVGGTNGVLFRFFPETRRYHRIPGVPLTTIWEIIPLNDSILALATINGLMALNLRSGVFTTLADTRTEPALPGNIILAMCRDVYGKFWLGTSAGLAVYDPQTRKIETLVSESFLPQGLPENRIVALLPDRNGLMWIGTWNEGVAHTPVQETGFHLSETPPDASPAERLENTQKICWDAQGQIYASSWSGLIRVNPENNRIEKTLCDTSKPGTLATNRLWGILSDSKNRLWVGSHDHGLYCRDKPGGPLLKVDTLPGMKSRLRFSAEITEDRKGRIWVGTFLHGLALWDEEKKNFSVFTLKAGPGPTLPALNQINLIREGPDGKLWLGTNGGGLVIFDPDSKAYQIIPPNQEKGGIFNGFVMGIAFTGNTIWLSTEGGGILYAPLNKPAAMTSFNQQTGLDEKNLPAMQTDRKGNLWLGGSALWLIETAGKKPQEITRIKSFQSGSLLVPQRWQSAVLSRDGRLAFAGNRAILYFHPDQIRLPAAPQVALADMFAGEKTRLSDSALHEKTRILIPAGLDYFSLQIANLNFFGQDKSRCIYQLEGVHPEPVMAGPSALITISGLRPGLHAFRFRAQNEAGLESPEVTVWIEKLPHWWQTGWFLFLCILFALALLYAFIRWQIGIGKRKSEEKSRAELEKLELELKALRSQMNPHFLFNALNSIDHFIWKNDALKASDYLARFSRLMRMILENSRHNRIPLEEELQSLNLYLQLEQMRMEYGFDSEIVTENLPGDLLIPPMLIQPLAENAIHHGLMPLQYRGRLQIEIRQITPGKILVTIEDNGVGRPPEFRKEKTEARPGLGLSITRERIVLLNEGREDSFSITDLKDAAGKACGTRVEFTLPFEDPNEPD
jgi:ligand-binding sensor domain-containing protein